MMVRILIVLCVMCGVAVADDDVAGAKKHFAAGAKAYAAQDFKSAAQQFDQAYARVAMPEIAFSAAQAHRRQYRIDGDVVRVHRAIELYRAYLAKVQSGGRVGDATDNLAEMLRELDKLGGAAKLKPAVAAERTLIGVTITKADQATTDAGTLREIGEGIGGELVGVTATLDGNPVTPFAMVEVEPGEHVFAVSADGYFPVEKKQHAVSGVPALVEIELRPKPARVQVVTEAGARITVDGRPASGSMLELATGKHVVSVLRRGRLPFGREISVARGQQLTLQAPLDKTPRRKAVPWVLGGAGTLAAISIVTAIGAVVADGAAEDARNQIAAGNASIAVADDYDRQIGRRDDLKTTAIVFGAGALVAGAVGFGLYLFDTPSSEGLRVTPVATPGGMAVTVGGRL